MELLQALIHWIFRIVNSRKPNRRVYKSEVEFFFTLHLSAMYYTKLSKLSTCKRYIKVGSHCGKGSGTGTKIKTQEYKEESEDDLSHTCFCSVS